MVSDFFELGQLLKEVLPEKVPSYEDHMNDLVGLLVFSSDSDVKLSPEDLSALTGETEERIKNFLVIDLWLNNHLHLLTGGDEDEDFYSSWQISDCHVQVFFRDGRVVRYNGEDIARSIVGAHNDVEWSFPAITAFHEEMMQI